MTPDLRDTPGTTATVEYANDATAARRVHPLLRFFATRRDCPPLSEPTQIDRQYRRWRLSLMIAITFGYGFMYTCRLGLSVVKKPLIDGGIFNAADLGFIGSTLLWGYAFGRLVNGFLADHANLRKFFTIGMLLTAGVNLVMGSATGLWLWAFLWGLNGWFQGFGAPSSIVSIAHWFRSSQRGRAYGVWSLSHSLGEGLTVIGTAALVTHLGWRWGFVGPGIFGLFAALFIWTLMRDRPQSLGLPSIEEYAGTVGRCRHCEYDLRGSPGPVCPECGASIEPPGDEPALAGDESPALSQWHVLTLPALWVLCLASAMMYMTRYAIMSWGILYLQEARGYSLIQAGSILGVNTAAGVAGCVAYGFISDMLFKGRRPPVTLIFGIVEVVSLFVIFFAPPGHPLLLTGAFIVYGFTLSGLLAVLGGLFATDIVPQRMVGAAIGLTGVCSYAAAAVQERISGTLIHAATRIEVVTDAAGAVVSEIKHYDFSKPIAFWIGSSVLSLLLASSLWKVRVRE